ncbi:hypothetical protein C8R45DRAFT_180459 [Mycena sanguinolenta]|nr:hypothetical protein C8R45DRAFT_180459 [Mycena sanguinolenta]
MPLVRIHTLRVPQLTARDLCIRKACRVDTEVAANSNFTTAVSCSVMYFILLPFLRGYTADMSFLQAFIHAVDVTSRLAYNEPIMIARFLIWCACRSLNFTTRALYFRIRLRILYRR